MNHKKIKSLEIALHFVICEQAAINEFTGRFFFQSSGFKYSTDDVKGKKGKSETFFAHEKSCGRNIHSQFIRKYS